MSSLIIKNSFKLLPILFRATFPTFICAQDDLKSRFCKRIAQSRYYLLLQGRKRTGPNTRQSSSNCSTAVLGFEGDKITVLLINRLLR
jgi:hypothetical protein